MPLVRELAIDQMLMTQLQKANQESRNIITESGGKSLILSHCHKLLRKF